MAHAVESAPTVAVPAELLAEVIESLDRCGCQFDMCRGETLAPVDMVTCHRCEVLARLRTVASGSSS